MPLLNLGCGKRFHPDWVNMDLRARPPHVLGHDITKSLPFPDAHFDAVYHSHVLEHLTREDGRKLFAECFRVLKPGGILRIAVPDLERICRTYVEKLDGACRGDQNAAADYEWITLELLDQMTRTQSGGEMVQYLQRDEIPNEDFILRRNGEEARELLEAFRRRNQKSGNRRAPVRGRGLMGAILGAKKSSALAEATFRQSGEVHRWMYDRYSLGKLMRETGFSDPVVRNADESAIQRWTTYHLDTLENGGVIKPDSLFMEAKK